MIKTENLTPEVYYKRSRDFQLLGRIYDIVFNYLKTNTDTISNSLISDNINDDLLDLVCTTLGFKEMHSYNSIELKNLCSIFTYIIRNKGNINSIETVINMLIKTYNIKEPGYVEMDYDNYICNIYIPANLDYTILLEDILSYIIPAGIRANIIKQSADEYELDTDTYVPENNVKYENILVRKSYQTSCIPQYNEQIKPSDQLPGRNDNSTLVRWDDDSRKPLEE